MEPMLVDFTKITDTVEHGEPYIPLVANVSGSFLGNGETLSADYLCEHIRRSVRVSDSIQTASDGGNHVFLEIGPDAVPSGISGRVLSGESILPSLRRGHSNWATLSKAIN
jgi:acyl transferase domain-containing protein